VRDQALGRAIPPRPVQLLGKSRLADAQRVMRPLLAGNGPVQIRSVAGLGKSTVLNYIANHERTRQRYRRIWWLDDPQHLIQALILLLNQGQVLMEDDPRKQVLMLRDALTDDTLLVVDNCTPETVEFFTPLTRHLLMAVEIPPPEPDEEDDTAHEPSPEPEDVVTLQPLPHEDALELMIHTCGMTDRNNLRGQMRAWITHLVRLLDGHPLAMVVAGALFREDSLPMERVIELFNDRIVRDQPDPTVALDISLEAMPSDYQQLLDAFGLLPLAGASFEALAAAVKMNNNLAVHRGLAFLIKHGFVQRVGAYYAAHRLVWERTSQYNADSKKLGDRLRSWCLSVARRHREEPEQIYRFQREILHTIDLAKEQRQNGFIQKISVSLGAYLREYTPRYLEQDVPAPRLVGARARAATLIGEGLRHLENGELEAAGESFAEGVQETDKHGSDHELAEALVAAARYFHYVEQYDTATRYLERAARLVFDLKATQSLHIIRLGLARVYRSQERYKDALSVLDDESDTVSERVRIYRAMQDWPNLIATLAIADDMSPYIKAEAYLQAKHYAAALETIAEARDSESSFLRAIIYHLQHDYENAIRGYEMAIDTVSKQNPRRIAMMLAMAKAHVNRGDIAKARQVLNQSLEIYNTLANVPVTLRGEILESLAALELMDRDTVKAIDLAEQALEIFAPLPPEQHTQTRANLYRTLGRAFERQRRYPEMRATFEQEVNLVQTPTMRDEQRIGVALHHLGDAYAAVDERDRSIANYRRALTHKNASEAPLSYFITQTALFDALYEEQRFGQALEVCQLALKHLNQRPPADLQHIGYMLCSKARAEQELDTLDAAYRTLQQWMTLLAGRIDALQDNRPNVVLLALKLCTRSLLANNRATEALPLTEQALHIAEHHHPGTQIAWSVRRDLGQSRLGVEDWEGAIAALQSLLGENTQVAPYTHALAHEYTAMAQGQLGNYAHAQHHLQIAFDTHPNEHYRALLLEKMSAFYVEMGDAQQAIQTAQAALPLLDRDRHPGDAARILTNLARLLSGTNQYADSIGIYEDALTMLRALPDASAVHTANVYNSLAASHEAQGQFPQAAIAYRNALDTLENTRRGSPADHRAILVRLGKVQTIMHNYDEAIALYLQARSETERYGNPEELGFVIAGLADTYRAAEQFEEALFAYEEALDIQPADDMPRARAATLRGYGQTLSQLNQLAEARDAWSEALTITTDESQLEIALTHRSIALAFAAQGMYEDAERSFQEAISYHDNGTLELAETLRLRGQALLDAQRHEEAVPILQAALDLEKSQTQQVNNRIVETLSSLAEGHEHCGDVATAIACHHEALVYTDRSVQPIQTANRYRLMGRLYSIQESWRDAHKALEEALNIEMNYKPRSDNRIAQTLELIAQTYRREGDLQRAAEAYKRMASYANLSKTADADLKRTLGDIDRHRETLNAARASLDVLLRTSDADIKDIVYVYALLATSYDGLSQDDKAAEAIDKLLTKLEENAHSLSTVDERPTYRALAHLFEGSQAASSGNLIEARAHFQRALHDTTDRSMRWVIEQGLASVRAS